MSEDSERDIIFRRRSMQKRFSKIIKDVDTIENIKNQVI